MTSDARLPVKDEFLRKYRFSISEFKSTELEWSFLEEVCARHYANLQELQTTGEYILQRLRSVPAVHSLKIRIKEPEHLIAKIIRKKLDTPTREISIDNYETNITDLIGIKALHLLKNQWRPIHEFVIKTWDLVEKPIAYIRDGDPQYLTKELEESGCTVEEHTFGYRSVHYLLKSLPARHLQIAELQVRTLFEEGWSEIDHQVRYPRETENPQLSEFLTIFNRLAGSADEMGTFIQGLSNLLAEQKEKFTTKERELEAMEQELKTTISKLKISQKEKKDLESQVEQLRRSSEPRPFLTSMTSPILPESLRLTGDVRLSEALGTMKLCSKCFKTYSDYSFSGGDKCPNCRMT
jgi:putative GTP pyrophosphokinase